MIEAKHLSKHYADREAVSDVSFTVSQGEIVGFLGPNGAGKTTTIRMLATYLPPTSGTATVAGFDILENGDRVRAAIGYLPENPPLYPEMRVCEYLNFVARIRGLKGAVLKDALERVMQQCFISDVALKLCGHLSKGYRQRVGLAQAIIHDPQVLILDEPTSGLDPRQITEIRQLIKSLAAGRAVLLSTHILPEVQLVCSKVVIVNRGRTVLEKKLSELVSGRSLEDIFLGCIKEDSAIAQVREA